MRRRRAAVICAAAAALAPCATASAAEVADRPDLVISLPGTPYAGQVAPVFVDAYEEPGRLLYRFDAVIGNQGGTLDLFKPPGGGVRQAIWAGRRALDRRRGPTRCPQGPTRRSRTARWRARASSTRSRRRTSTGTSPRRRATSSSRRAARRASRTRSASACSTPSGRASTSSTSTRAPGARRGAGSAMTMQAKSVRMGLSPGASDRYGSQREFQWVDITGVAPGPATLRGRGQPAAVHPRARRGQQHHGAAARGPGRPGGGGRGGDRGRRAGGAHAGGRGRGARGARPPRRRVCPQRGLDGLLRLRVGRHASCSSRWSRRPATARWRSPRRAAARCAPPTRRRRASAARTASPIRRRTRAG